MSAKPPGPQNRIDTAALERTRNEERQRRDGLSIWAEEVRQAEIEARRARSLVRQIEATKQNGRDDNGERLRELGREYHQLRGTGGGAI